VDKAAPAILDCTIGATRPQPKFNITTLSDITGGALGRQLLKLVGAALLAPESNRNHRLLCTQILSQRSPDMIGPIVDLSLQFLGWDTRLIQDDAGPSIQGNQF
jgi:hypothetical protein